METDDDRDREFEAWVHSAYRSSPDVRPQARERLRRALAQSPPPGRSSGVLGWLLEPVALHVRPAMLMGSVAMVAVVAWFALQPLASEIRVAGRRPAAPAVPAAAARAVRPVDFTLIAPGARSVALVGDFNGWDIHATPLARVHESGLWAVVLPVEPGRHLYGFVVDGRWVCDPGASLSDERAFGQRNSVLVVESTI